MRTLICGTIGTGWLDLVFPPQCVVCGNPVGMEQGLAEWETLLRGRAQQPCDRAYEMLWLGGQPPEPGVSNFLCPHCLALLSFAGWVSCPRCGGRAETDPPSADGCSWCRRERFAFSGVVSLGPYIGPLQDVVLRIKHASGERLAHCMARLFCCERSAQLRKLTVDCVVPIPMFPRQRRQRGINSPEVLAETIARFLRVPVAMHLLRRVRATRPQRSLKPRERWRNVRGAFTVANAETSLWGWLLSHVRRPRALQSQVGDSAEQPVDMKKREITAPARFPKRGPLDGQRVLLVDDVLTTGATCHFAAEALIAAGARDVFVAVLARGQGDEDSGMTPSAVP